MKISKARSVLEQLRFKEDGLNLYNAGLPGFPRNFSRDSIIAAILLQDSTMLKDQLIFSASKQGKVSDPDTGEEPGKIFHEYPGVMIRGRSTLYNACDTTALFLIGHKIYLNLTKRRDLLKRQQKQIMRAVNYIETHLQKGLFIESPKFCGAKQFALKATYWKDSEVLSRKNGEPAYPISYFLTQVQNMHALRCAYSLTRAPKINVLFLKMRRALKLFLDPKTFFPYIALDARGPIKGVSSDGLHALFYLGPKDLPKKCIEAIATHSQILETKQGYLSLEQKASKKLSSKYHADIIWPFEQAIIHIGARKFGLSGVMEVSAQVASLLKTTPELITTQSKPKGNDPQLWTIAAKQYFLRNLRK